jgi:hypothetical protein
MNLYGARAYRERFLFVKYKGRKLECWSIGVWEWWILILLKKPKNASTRLILRQAQ